MSGIWSILPWLWQPVDKSLKNAETHFAQGIGGLIAVNPSIQIRGRMPRDRIFRINQANVKFRLRNRWGRIVSSTSRLRRVFTGQGLDDVRKFG